MNLNNIKRIMAALLASAICISIAGCGKDTENNTDIDKQTPETEIGADEEIKLPENENKQEEIIINDNYADSELIDFEGTIDEIYEDGSMLIYSPFFGVNYDYKAIVELDENSVIDGFEPKVNNCVRFDVYSSVKRSEPLTVVASKLTLVKEASTQREEEAARKAEVQKRLEEYLNGGTQN